MDGGDFTEFGPFRLFPAERRLLKGETPVQIGSRALDILIVLVERAGELVTKQEILSRVWPDVLVEESSVRVHIAALRKALDEGSGQSRYIVNVTGRGYTFVASVAAATNTRRRSWPGAPPRLATRVIGRERELIAVAELLAAHRFVTIHGAGGIGKTTLALAVIQAQALAGPNDVCFVDLSLSTSAHSVADALASALGLMVRTDDPTASILDFTRDRKMILLLDSCETSIEEAATLVERIVQDTTGVWVLTTSREPLRARDEHVYALAPLISPPEHAAPVATELLAFPAAELFCERAIASGYRATLGDAEAVTIADICRKVEGNALAIELAAGRVNTYGLQQTADMLGSHLRLAWQGRRTAPARHQTLNAMLDWSYALINEPERQLLRQLSVFVGPFVLEDAHAVACSGDNITESLEQLVLKSLVAADTAQQPPRYRLLDTTRAYANAKLLQSGAAQEAARRHARYYLELVDRIRRLRRHAGEVCFKYPGRAGMGVLGRRR